jgi:hypothetical protein
LKHQIICDISKISAIEGVRDRLEISKAFNGFETFDTLRISKLQIVF